MKKTITLIILSLMLIPSLKPAMGYNLPEFTPETCGRDQHRYTNIANQYGLCLERTAYQPTLNDLEGLRILMTTNFTNTMIDKVTELRKSIIEDLKSDPEFRRALIKELKAELNK